VKKNRTDALETTYNTQLEELIMPEYGRNVQQLVRHAQQIEDPVVRQAFCEEIVTLIQQLYPQAKNVEDYRGKLWKHLFQIAKYKLDAQTPSGEVPTPEDAKKKPERVPYPQQETRFRHYGNNLQNLIRKAREMEDSPVKKGFVSSIGSYMKLAYRTWNMQHFISDEIIKNDLVTLSEGALSLDEDIKIDNIPVGNPNINRPRPNNNNQNNRPDRRNNNPNNNNNSGNRNNNNNSGNNSGGNRSNSGNNNANSNGNNANNMNNNKKKNNNPNNNNPNNGNNNTGGNFNRHKK
jgi:hypothetical protein